MVIISLGGDEWTDLSKIGGANYLTPGEKIKVDVTDPMQISDISPCRA